MNYLGVIFYILGIIAGIIIFFYLIGISGISNDRIGIIKLGWSLTKEFDDQSSGETLTQLSEKLEMFKEELLSIDKGNNTKG